MRSNADVVCLQEVMFTVFEDDLVPALRGLGYDGLMQNDRKRGDTHPQGVAIFWKRDKLSLSGECHRTRTMVAVLADSEDRRCAVVNCHLEGRPDKSVARVKQLQTTLAELVRKHPHHGLVVCGDFNCMLGSSACGAYLAFGAAAPGVLEWDHEVPVEVLAIAPHPYSLTSAYDFDPAAASIGKVFTYCGQPGQPVDGLDQVWHTHGELACVARRPLFASDEQRVSMIRTGLPGPACPSDHVPVGAAFTWVGRGSWHEDAARGGGGGGGSRGGGEGKEGGVGGGGGGGGGAPQSSAALFEEASALLAACPLTDIERVEFNEVAMEVGGVPAKGRPPPEVIVALKEQRQRKEQLLATVSDEARQILARVTTLRKQAKKRQGAETRAAQGGGGGGKQQGKGDSAAGGSGGGGGGGGSKKKNKKTKNTHRSSGGGEGGGGAVEGGRRAVAHDVKLSKLLSLVLRHKAVELGLAIAPDGFVALSELLAMPQFIAVSATEESVRRVAQDNDKQRFSIVTDEKGSVRVRANQGHTMECVKSEALLERIVAGEGGANASVDSIVCVHGTPLRNWKLIKTSGLCRMARNHVHFARGLPGEDGVISGMRSSSELLIYVDVERAIAAGIAFYRSSNGVILSPGVGAEGFIPVEFFDKVVRVSDGVDLLVCTGGRVCEGGCVCTPTSKVAGGEGKEG